MDLITILRELWLRRLRVAVGFVLAACVGVVSAYHVQLGLPPRLESRQYDVGIASAAVLIDSPSSQAADLGGGSDLGPQADVSSLAARARLIAAIMAASPLKDQIATRAGIAPSTLIARAPGVGVAPDPSPLSSGTVVDPSDPRANILTVTVNETLPILSANSQAPTAAAAARISSAVVATLPLYLQSVASGDRVPSARQLVVKPLGPARYATVRHGPRRVFAVVAVFLLFAGWCVAIVAGGRLARSWRDAAADEAAAARAAMPKPPDDLRTAEPPIDLKTRSPLRRGLRRGRSDPATLAAGAGQASDPQTAPTGDEPTMPTHAVNV